MIDNQEKVIKLINKIEELFDYFDIDDILMTTDYDNNLKIFSKYLNELFKEGLNNEILDMISKIDKKEIFYVEQVDEFKNNKIRKEIGEYLNKLPLYFDYEIIKKNIKNNYKLAIYINDRDKLLELVDINEKVILLLQYKYLSVDFIIKQMKKSNFITEVLLGMHGMDNDLYKYSMNYDNNDEINKLLYKQIKKYIEEDIYKYIKASDLVKNNNDISNLVLTIDPNFKYYINNDKLKYVDCTLPIIDCDKIFINEAYQNYDNKKIEYNFTHYNSLYEVFANIINYYLYYSYDINNKHAHNHSFESVIKDLYYHPKTFYIHKEDEQFFSMQELSFLNRLKNLLNAIGLEDVQKYDEDEFIKRARNKKLKELLECKYLKMDISNLILNGKVKTFLCRYFDYLDIKKNMKYLLLDEDDNYLCLIKTRIKKMKLKDLEENMIDYKSYGYDTFLEYKKYVKKHFNIDENDFIDFETVLEITKI